MVVNPEKHIGKSVDRLKNWREFQPAFGACQGCGGFFPVDDLDFDYRYREGEENDLFCAACRVGDWRDVIEY